MKQLKILVIDLGSQYSVVIGRTLRELGFRSAILSPKMAESWLKENKPQAIILSGGNASVYQKEAPFPPRKILKMGIPILGICYGMQWLAKELGGSIISHKDHKEYGETKVKFFLNDPLFNFDKISREEIVWASHGDSIGSLPAGFKVIARSNKGKTIAAMSNQEKKIWAVQFHPEVTQTKRGKDIFLQFIDKICNCAPDWHPKNIIDEIKNEIKKTVGNKRAIIGFSGGVDSSTLAAISSSVLDSNLLAISIDSGGLRKNEIEEIQENAKAVGIQLKIIKASRRFQTIIGNTIHSEIKRKRFKKLYRQILEETAKNFKAKFIFQGSLATDFIEAGGTGEATVIKSHHNIGLRFGKDFIQLHPFRDLFKYEVRELAKELKLPASIFERQPFPGPGLFIRIIGSPPKSDKLSIVKWADNEVIKSLKKSGLYQDISQLIVALDCNRTVGIKGDARIYGFSIIVRGVKTLDFMTAKGYQLPADVRREISSAITKHPKIVRVFFDETDKPPATTELE